MIKNLRRKFVVISMCSTLAVLLVIMGALNLTSYRKILERTDRLMDMLEENQGRFPKEPDGKKGEKPDPEGMSPEARYETRFFSAELDQAGSILTLNLGQIASVEEEEAKTYAAEVYEGKKDQGFIGEYRYRAVKTEEGVLLIFVNLNRDMESFRIVLATSVFVAALGLLMVFFLVSFFSRMVFRPVAESYEKQRRFITDASHELKTPLTIIEANTEVLEMECGENEWTKSTRNQIRRLTDLTGQLVALSRMDEEKGMGVKVEFSISDAVGETAEAFRAPAVTQGKRLELKIEKELSWYGDEKSIRQLISLLLDNAVKYSSQNGEIHLNLYRKGKNLVLRVKNPADGVPQGRLDMLFERFYRLDVSRNSQTGGSGIGLSVAKAIVASHKGKIRAENRDGKSLEITVTLPQQAGI